MSTPENSSPLDRIAALTGKPVSYYEELLEAMVSEDRVERFPNAVAYETGMPLHEVLAALGRE